MSFFAHRRRPHDDDEDESFDSLNDFTEPRGRYLGGVVPVELLAARSESAAVGIRGLVAYPHGFEFTVVAWVRSPKRPRRGRRFRPSILMSPMDFEDDEMPDEFLRFGLEFPDGASVTNLDDPNWMMSSDATEPTHGMESHTGGGSDDHYKQEWWAWPLPTEGTLTFVCEWPAHGIAETRVEVSASLIIAAASRAIPVWSDRASGSTYGGQ